MAAVLAAAIVLASAGALACAESSWTTSLKTATAQARKTGKPILIDFTGSDWCPWCMKLHAEVFDTPAFATWAADNVVLLECDFPNGRQPPADIKAQNAELAQKFNVSGYPTVVFIDADGNELGRTGYIQGGADAWIRQASKLVGSRPKTPPKPPEVVNFVAGLSEALKTAKATGKPLLMVAMFPKNTDSSDAVDALTTNRDFIRIANARAVPVLLKLPLAVDSDEDKAHADLVKALKLFATQGVALIDVAANKVLYRAGGVAPKAEVLVNELRKALPPLKYEGGWIEDFVLAQDLSVQLKRPMLLDFTGSDWCPWCIKLDKEIFATEAFQKYAADNLILVKLDYPRRTPQPDAVKQQNAALEKKFAVEGFPTVVLYAAGKTLGRLGYQDGGPDPFIAAVRKALAANGVAAH
jgi:protein disulfide-isomerase